MHCQYPYTTKVRLFIQDKIGVLQSLTFSSHLFKWTTQRILESQDVDSKRLIEQQNIVNITFLLQIRGYWPYLFGYYLLCLDKKARRPISKFLPSGFSLSFFLSFSLFVYYLHNISMLRGFGFVQGYVFQSSYCRDVVSFSLSFILAVSFSLLHANDYTYIWFSKKLCMLLCARSCWLTHRNPFFPSFFLSQISEGEQVKYFMQSCFACIDVAMYRLDANFH